MGALSLDVDFSLRGVPPDEEWDGEGVRVEAELLSRLYSEMLAKKTCMNCSVSCNNVVGYNYGKSITFRWL